jgi:hypothetical protein
VANIFERIGNYFENLSDAIREGHRSAFEEKIRKTSATSKFIGDFQWVGPVEDVSKFSVLFASLRKAKLAFAILSYRCGHLFLCCENYTAEKYTTYSSFSDEYKNRTDYHFARREISTTTSRDAVAIIRGQCGYSEDKLLKLFHLFEVEANASAQPNVDNGTNNSSGSTDKEASTTAGGLSVANARELLGVADDATEDQINLAYKRLSRKVHPDAGGSTFLMKQVNLARELLLSRLGSKTDRGSRQ